ncbi:MAG: MBL fold metallo-hydrolase [Lachnospiraceae bacterium]|nr:MBL fold metallo-hydrolase [Lachnospiraceae bacterium]
MIIRTLIEDTNGTLPVKAEHGLSFLAETKTHRYLLDTGASDRTWDNADTLGENVTDVDAVVLSHGHYDHTGGLMGLVRRGYRGPVYMRDNADLPYYNLREYEKYIGIDPEIRKLPGLVLTPREGITKTDETLSLFSGVSGTRFEPEGNRTLYEKKDGQFIKDSFEHEQYAALTEDSKSILISGCAHKGIVNILERYRELYGSYPDAVVSGFHMMNADGYDEAAIKRIREVAEVLAATGVTFFTGHCTGIPAYEEMKPVLRDRLVYLHAGDRVEL